LAIEFSATEPNRDLNFYLGHPTGGVLWCQITLVYRLLPLRSEITGTAQPNIINHLHAERRPWRAPQKRLCYAVFQIP